MHEKAIEELAARLREDQVSTSRSTLELHSRGEAYDLAVLPDAVVFPESTEEVRQALLIASQYGVPVTPVGANSSLEGHTVPLKGGISLDMTRMDRILEFRPEDLLAVVQPGVTYPRLNDFVRHSGLFFPIDPGAHASIGGMVSTNASGTAAVRYGVTSDYVLALEIVTARGEILRTGSRARKSSSGYDLNALFCGAEGTLGVITEATLGLVGSPEAASAARVPFESAAQATAFVTSLIQAGIPVARCELIDPLSIRAINEFRGTDYPEAMTIFLEFHGSPAGVEAEARFARELAIDWGAQGFESSSEPETRARLWEARHSFYYAVTAANDGRASLATDVAVPISKLPEAVDRSLDCCRTLGLDAYLVGHVGDGNFHVTVFHDGSEAERRRVDQAGREIVMHALSLGGTSTGEHGVGIRKLAYMEAEHGPALDLMRLVKAALDPMGIMNPGKKIPPAGAE